MDKSYFFDEEFDEIFYEKLEKQIPEKEIEFLRNVYDEGWDVPLKMNLRIMN